jgi:hypothetical protein
LPNQSGPTLSRQPDLPHVGGGFRIDARAFQHAVCRTDDCRQEIIEIMRDTACELTHRLQLAVMRALRFRFLARLSPGPAVQGIFRPSVRLKMLQLFAL